MFKTRLLSGIVLVIIAVLSVAAGGPVLFAVLLGISLVGVNELYRAMEVHQKDSVLWKSQAMQVQSCTIFLFCGTEQKIYPLCSFSSLWC